MARVFVIGGANIDIFARSDEKIIPHDSNIAKISFSYGGVGRNISENITNLGEDIYFVSAFSNDYFGKKIAQDCLDKGFNLAFSKFVDNVPSSIYISIFDNDGGTYVSCNDMEICNCIDQNMIFDLINVITDEDYVIVDTNLNEDTITYIFDNLKGKKIVDAVSVNKIHRLQKVIKRIDILKLNRIEAETVYNGKLIEDADYINLLNQMTFESDREVVITNSEGVYVGYHNEVYFYGHNELVDSLKKDAGAGDAFLAAYVYGDLHKVNIESKCCLGLAASRLTILSGDSVAKYNIHDVSKQLTRMHIKGGKLKTN
ncbi:MAG: PfkB family carbohydrate kinase [Erysipelotrichaceae bacterium]|nr:PfkB family carbohydrate kinase [Erysipelotrichaceae bacterium]